MSPSDGAGTASAAAVGVARLDPTWCEQYVRFCFVGAVRQR
ncbi:hypothetical protein AB0C96_14980 [Streptomyces sp. NPDC048506]